jgi:hypothetical protein
MRVTSEKSGRIAVNLVAYASDPLFSKLNHNAQPGYAILGRRSSRISQFCQTAPGVSTRQGCTQLPVKDKWILGRDFPENVFVRQIFTRITRSELCQVKARIPHSTRMYLARPLLGRGGITRRDVITATGFSGVFKRRTRHFYPRSIPQNSVAPSFICTRPFHPTLRLATQGPIACTFSESRT